MTIYIDIIFIENIIMNYIILLTTVLVSKGKVKKIRLLLAAMIGAGYASIMYMAIWDIFTNVLIKILLSVIMISVATSPNSIKKLVKQLIVFYLASFSLGGATFALLYFVKPENIFMKNGVYVGTYPLKVAILGGIVGFIVMDVAFKIIKNRIIKQSICYKLEIFFEDKSVIVEALVDTGNFLKEPITGMPVIIVEREKLKQIIPGVVLEQLEGIVNGELNESLEQNYLSRLKVIPFTSLGKSNGMLLGFKVDFVKIFLEEDEVERKVIVGIYDNVLDKNGGYSALIGVETIKQQTNKNGVTV